MTTQPTGELASGAMDRVLVLEMVRVTEAAAMAAASMIGRGDEKAADAAAVEAMRAALNDLYMDGTVVVGEGERDEAPMLYIGEKVGNAPGKGPKIDIALDPLEGTTITAKAGPNAMAVLAVAEEGNLLNAPDVYMEKLAVGPGYSPGIIDLAKTPTENVLAVAKEIAHRHHEKWDGSGYPDGLAGDGIPVSARLMALADVFDALTSRRVYKPPMSTEQAAAIILQGRGVHFDPDVVDAFIATRDRFDAIARRYSDGEQPS